MMVWTTVVAADVVRSYQIIRIIHKDISNVFSVNAYLLYYQVFCHLLAFIPRQRRQAPEAEEFSSFFI